MTTALTPIETDRQETEASTRKVFIKTYGCQMNVYDSTRMQDALAEGGYSETASMYDADLILLNTCHIREKAAEKVYSELGRIKQVKTERERTGKSMLIGVAGCVAQAEGEEIVRRAPVVDLVFGPQSYHHLPALVGRAANGETVVETDLPTEEKFEQLPAPRSDQVRARGVTAFLTVQEGCDKFCSFCVVPYTRGAEVSRPVTQVITEARQLAAAGVREITLLGQTVNAYHGLNDDGETIGLGTLLRILAEIPGLDRLRYTTSHPRDMADDLISAHRDLPQLMPYLHLPVQAGSDRVLKAMNRRHTAETYLKLIDEIRVARPDIAISGDFIVGFPGETDEDFQQTLRLIEQVGYAQAFSFKYSIRPGTPGAELTHQVPEDAKSARLAELQALLTHQQQAFQTSRVGMICDVLMERPGRHDGQLVGRSPWLQPVHLSAPTTLIGEIVPVRITGSGANSLAAELIETPDTLRQTA